MIAMRLMLDLSLAMCAWQQYGIGAGLVCLTMGLVYTGCSVMQNVIRRGGVESKGEASAVKITTTNSKDAEHDSKEHDNVERLAEQRFAA